MAKKGRNPLEKRKGTETSRIARTPMFLYDDAAELEAGHWICNGRRVNWNPTWEKISQQIQKKARK